MGFVMRHVISRFSLSLIAACLGAAIMTSAAYAQAAKGASGLPLPRFVSLKSKSVNLRIGPSVDYAVAFRYMKPGVPVEIIQEYDNWRRIRDADGTEGWVNQALLSGDRTAVAAPGCAARAKASSSTCAATRRAIPRSSPAWSPVSS